MADRRPIKKAHERFHVKNFLEWFNRVYRSDFRVIEEPEPPEAIIQSSRTIRWVEISTAFWNDSFARDEFSYATPGEKHQSIGPGPFINMDREFASNFVTVLRKKLEKKSYLPVMEKYGPGYLIIPIRNPFFNEETIRWMKNEWANASVSDLGYFRSVRICFRSMNNYVYYRWPRKGTK